MGRLGLWLDEGVQLLGVSGWWPIQQRDHGAGLNALTQQHVRRSSAKTLAPSGLVAQHRRCEREDAELDCKWLALQKPQSGQHASA